MTVKLRLLLGLMSILMLAACGGNLPPPTATLVPTATSTPLSTALPSVPTEIPAGYSEDNAIRIVFAPADEDEASGLVDSLTLELTERTGLSIEVVLVDTDVEALAAVCESSFEQVSVAWLNGMTYAAGFLQGCGSPVLAIERGTPREPDRGATGVLLLYTERDEEGELVNEELDLSVITESTFCRTSYRDLFSWVIPTVFLRSNGYTVADLENIDELEDYDAMVQGLRDGTCAAVGLPEDAWDEYVDDDRTLEDAAMLADTSEEIPYQVMLFPQEISLPARDAIVNTLLELDRAFGSAEPIPDAESAPDTEADSTDAEADPATPVPVVASPLDGKFAAFFGEGVFIRVTEDDYSDFIEFLQESGIDFAQLGQ